MELRQEITNEGKKYQIRRDYENRRHHYGSNQPRNGITNEWHKHMYQRTFLWKNKSIGLYADQFNDL